MAVQSISSQPISGDLLAAYRPIIIEAVVDNLSPAAAPPIVYCDIYFNGTYYKSLTRTKAKSLTNSNATFSFDIQDAAQEYITKFLPDNGSNLVISAPSLMASTSCKIRVGSYDSNGLLVISDTAPVQGTGAISAINGTGFSSNEFKVIGATLQHEDNQSLSTHLNSFKDGTWASNAFPLSHRPVGFTLALNQSDYFPIAYLGNNSIKSLRLNYKLKGSNSFITNTPTHPGLVTCPLLTNIQYNTNISGSNQTFTFTWDTPSPLLTSMDIMMRPSGGAGNFVNQLAASNVTSGKAVTVGLGGYDVYFVLHGACIDSRTPTIYGIGTTGAGACSPVLLPTSWNLPNAVVGTAYSYTMTLRGDAPFVLGTLIKPNWMTVNLSGNVLSFGGTPTGSAGSFQVQFPITNCSNTNVVTLSQYINVSVPSTDQIVVANGFTSVTIGHPYASGTITGNPGDIVVVRISLGGTDPDATLGYGVFGHNGTLTNNTHIDIRIVMPAAGIQVGWFMQLYTEFSSEGGSISLL